MKKHLRAAIILITAFSLCICSGFSACIPNKEELLVGFAMADITPEDPVPLAGYGNSAARMSEGSLDPIYTTALAISDGTDTILLIENDLTSPYTKVFTDARKAVREACGIPEEYVMISSSHNHSAPDLSLSDMPCIKKYTREFTDILVQTALEALADMKPASMYYGSSQPENLNFVRHYITEDGHVRGDSFGSQYSNSPLAAHTHDADNQLQAVRFVREEARDIVLVNWQTHPHRSGTRTNLDITADLIGVMRERVNNDADCEFIYFTGASGNINPKSYIESENITEDYISQGNALADAVLSILAAENPTKLNGADVKSAQSVYTAQVDHSLDHLADIAAEITAEWKQTNDSAAATEAGLPYGINSPYHANAITVKAELDKTADLKLYAHSVGELAFVFAPYEMFDENGVFIKENSPFACTFVVSCSNTSNGYIPSAEGYENSSYEANVSRFVSGTGEELADEFSAMLRELY